MASSKDRQRKLARAKLDRQMARRAVRERRRRRVLAGVGSAVALLLIVGGVAWIGGAFDKKAPADPTAGEQCIWAPQSATSNTSLKEVGTPPTKDIPTTGTETMTVATDQGDPITVALDVADAPCSAEDLSYLAGKKFYDNTACHEITTDGAVRCGDPTGTGQGGPTYSVYSENLPPAPQPSASPSTSAAPATPAYPKGTVALIGNPAGANGSQFLIFFKDFNTATPEYPIVGKVTGGLDTLAKIGKIPTVADSTGAKVKPKQKILITSLTVSGAAPATPSAPSASAQS